MAKKRAKAQVSNLTVDSIETKMVVLVDEYGKQRANLSCSGGDGGNGGFTLLQIFDDGGKPRIELQVDGTGNASIALKNVNGGSTGVSMVVSESGNGWGVNDHRGVPCISCGVGHPESNHPGGPNISVVDRKATLGWNAFHGVYSLPIQGEEDAYVPRSDESAPE